MNRHLFTRAAVVLLSGALLWPIGAAAQASPQTLSKRDQERSLVKPDSKRAKKLAELAAKEEAAGDFVGAMDDYEEAARYAPFDVTLVAKGAELRSRLLREHVDAAERLAVDGNLDGATLELATALEIDPGNPALLERLQQMGSMKASAIAGSTEEPAQGMPQLTPTKTTRSFNLQTDVQAAYEQIAQAFGLKAVFDPDLQARRTRVRLENVDFYTAMKIMGIETGTFWYALDSGRFMVAADTAEKRRELEPEVEETFALPNSNGSAEIGEVVRSLRELTGIQHVSQSLGSNSITVRGPADRVRLAAQIVRNLEHAPGEILLEIDLLEVDRNKARKLGVIPPASTTLYSIPPNLANSLRSATDLTSLLTLLTQVFGSAAGAAGGIASLATSIPPIAAIGGGKSTFLLGLPTFSAQFSDALSLVHSGRQVLLRAQDSKPATFFVGDRFPITLSLLSGSLGSTSFTANPGGTPITIPTEQFTVGNRPVAMVSADFRNAGTLDLALLNQADNTLTILLNQGTGAASQFAQPSSGIGLISPVSLGTNWTSSTPAPALATGSLNASSNATNNDSFADLAIADPVGNAVIILLGNGDGTFKTPAAPIPVGNRPSAIAIGTFNSNNGDTNPGFVVTNFTDNTYSVFNGNGDGTFTEVKGSTPATSSPFPLPASAGTNPGPVAMTVADFNNDGIPDLAIVNQNTKNVTILKGNGDGTFEEFPNSPLAVGSTPVAIASGSLSGSTGPGLAIVNQGDNTITVYLGNGNGTFFASSQSPLATSATPTGVAITDFTQQGNGGIAVANTGAGTVIVYADLGSGLFTNALEPQAGTNPTALVAGAFTTSTFPDVAVTNNISGADGQVTLIESPVSVISNSTINAQQPYPGSEYEDIGLKIKATPQLHDSKEVTLQLDFEIRALSGSNVNGIPIISNRTVTQTVRLKEDETSLVIGLLSQNENKTLSGFPLLATLPGAGYAFGNRNNTFADDELVFLITPRRVRSPLRQSKTIYAGTGEPSGAGRGGAGAFREREPSESPVPPVTPAPTPGVPGPPVGNPPAANPPAQQPPANPPPANQPPANQPEVPLQRPPE